MSVEGNQDCTRYRDELLRVACGDERGDMPAAARQHAESCEKCRAALAESQELLAAVSTALQPEPLSATVEARIHARLNQVTVSAPRATLRLLRPICTAAAAACLLIALLIPRGGYEQTPVTIALSGEEASAILSAYAALQWSGSVEYSIDQLNTQIDDIKQVVQRETDADSVLPWDAEDDWDVPSDTSETSRREKEVLLVQEHAGGSAIARAVIGARS